MPLELYMVGLIVRDMPKALQFYQRLELAIPDGSERMSHVEIKMGGMTFFLDSRPGRWDPAFGAEVAERTDLPPHQYPTILEFFLDSQAALEAKFAELVDDGYEGFRAPYLTSFGMCFAMIKDPDGNTILLSATATPA